MSEDAQREMTLDSHKRWTVFQRRFGMEVGVQQGGKDMEAQERSNKPSIAT